MNRLLNLPLAALILTATTATTDAQPRAGHSDYLTGLTRQAQRQPFRTDEVALIDVVKGGGAEVGARALLAFFDSERGRSLAAGAMTKQAEDDKILTYAGERGYLEVIGDGSKFRFRGNIDAVAGTDPVARQAVSKRDLERLGRRFVGSTLAEFVPLGEREQLTYLGARYLYESDGATEAQTAVRERARVVASIAVFGREIDGLPVVGSGSKVAVWFNGARQAVGFDVDWPVYRIATSRQRLLPRDELRRRVGATTVSPDSRNGVAVERFECGYVDLGATRRDDRLQAGCSIAYRGTGENQTWARIDFVPAGVEVLPERRWPLAKAIAAGRTVKVGSAAYNRYLDEAPAPTTPPPERPAQPEN